MHTYSLKVFIMLLPWAEALDTIKTTRKSETQVKLVIMCLWLNSIGCAVCTASPFKAHQHSQCKHFNQLQVEHVAPTYAHCWKVHISSRSSLAVWPWPLHSLIIGGRRVAIHFPVQKEVVFACSILRMLNTSFLAENAPCTWAIWQNGDSKG